MHHLHINSAGPDAMATPFYTTRDLQALLHVDRTTIYRMADAGRLPAVKVGSQWRFPRRPIDLWLSDQLAAPGPVLPPQPVSSSRSGFPTEAFPLECVQLVQDSFADALGVMVVITDLEGHPVTRASNPCGYLQAIEAEPQAYSLCLQWWAGLSRRLSLQPEFVGSPMDLLCARAFFRSGSELRGMVIFGGIAPEHWPPDVDRLEQIAGELGVDAEVLAAHAGEVFRADPAQQQRLLGFAQRLADIITHIISERQQFQSTLAQIAALAGA